MAIRTGITISNIETFDILTKKEVIALEADKIDRKIGEIKELLEWKHIMKEEKFIENLKDYIKDLQLSIDEIENYTDEN